MSQSLFQPISAKVIKPLLQNPQVQAYTMVVLSLFTMAFFGVVAIRPTLKTIANLQRQIDDKTLLGQKLEDKINALINAQEQYQKIQPSLSVVYNLLPETADIPPVIRTLQLIAANHEASISAIHFSPITLYGQPAKTSLAANEAGNQPAAVTPPATGLASAVQKQAVDIPLNVSFSGSYGQLMSLLEDLTKVERLISIKTIDFNIKADNQKSTLSVGIGADLHYLK